MADDPKVFGAFSLLKALGRGAMGDVWLARPLNPNRGIPAPIVVKRLHGELASKKGFVARFRHEAAVAVCVDSPHVAKVFDVGAVGDTLYIAMEYVPGWPLSRVLDAVLKSGRHASIASVIDLIAGGLEGLDRLHTATEPSGKPLEIVHRDISPKNLMVGEDGKMRLIDLGLGRSNAQDWKTRTGVVMGSVGYMPPEQARGERVDARADVYSMAVVCFEMLALRNYVKRGTLSAMMEASASPHFMKPSEFRPDVPPGLDEVLQRALSPTRDERYASARAFLDALRAIVAPSHTQGGMAVLLEELFGATRRERAAEVAALLALPLPDDAGEAEPTRVFVTRKGVLPPDLQPTQYARPDEVSLVPTVAREEITDTRVEPAKKKVEANRPTSTLPPIASALSRDGGVSPFVTSQQLAPPKAGVSIPVLLLAVVIAAILGGFVAVLVAGRIAREEPAELVELDPLPIAPPSEAPQIRIDSRKIDEPVAEVEVEKPVERAKQRPAKRKDPSAAVAEVAPPPPEEANIDAKLDRLATDIESLKARVDDQARKDEVMKLLLDVRVWRRKTENSDNKKRALEDLERRYAKLSS